MNLRDATLAKAKMVERYIESEGRMCPYCGTGTSPLVTGGMEDITVMVGARQVALRLSCQACYGTWMLYLSADSAQLLTPVAGIDYDPIGGTDVQDSSDNTNNL